MGFEGRPVSPKSVAVSLKTGKKKAHHFLLQRVKFSCWVDEMKRRDFTHLHSADTSESPEIRVGQIVAKLLLDGLESVAGMVQASIGAVVALRCESHCGGRVRCRAQVGKREGERRGKLTGSTVGAAIASLFVISTTGMPRQSDQNRTAGRTHISIHRAKRDNAKGHLLAAIVVVFVFKQLRDSIVHLLIVELLGSRRILDLLGLVEDFV